MAVKNSIKAIGLTSIDSAAVQLGVYGAINPLGLDEPCFLIRIVNNSNQAIFVSYRVGGGDDEYIPAGGSLNLNGQTNSSPNNYKANWAKGLVVLVRGTPGVGLITLSGYYQEGV